MHSGSDLNIAFGELLQQPQRLGICRNSPVLIHLAAHVELVIDRALFLFISNRVEIPATSPPDISAPKNVAGPELASLDGAPTSRFIQESRPPGRPLAAHSHHLTLQSVQLD
jgi:hypothetical protein